MIRVAVCGEGAAVVVTTLQSLGYDASAVSDQTSAPADVLVVLGLSGVAVAHRFSGTPAVYLTHVVDRSAIAAAADVGAIDIVMHGDAQRLRAAIDDANKHARVQAPQGLEGELVRRVLDLTPNYISVRDGSGRFVLASQSLADFYSTTVEELTGKPLSACTSDEEARLELEEDAEVLRTRRSKVCEREVTDTSGARRRLQIIKRPLVMSDRDVTLVMAIAVDVTRRYRTEATLENTADFLKNILETISESVFALDLSGKFTLVNSSLTELSGKSQQELLGSSYTKIFADTSAQDARRHFLDAVEAQTQRSFEARIWREDGHDRVASVRLLPLYRQGAMVGVVGTAEDVTDRRIAERRIEHLAYHDPLTNLPNRRLLHDRLQVALSQAMRDQRSVALLFLDLDRFKAINDTLGHRVGDMLLQELGARLRRCVRAGDTIARMGGDEFVIVTPALTSKDEATSIAEKVLEAVRVPFVTDGRELVVTASIGMSFYPLHALDGDALIRQADVALFECKHRGRDTWRVYDSSMSARTHEKFELEHDLRRALRNNELELHYQPVVDIVSKQILSVEALLRWQHPVHGMLLPDTFIALAEENGSIGRIGEWVIREALRQAAAWRDDGLPEIGMAINVSVAQFDGPIVETLADALREHQISGERIAIELTESILVHSAASPRRTIDELKQLGVKLAIDDFGTGYSSLSYLERFPIDTLKIDRTFMPADVKHTQSGLIASAVIALGEGLGMTVIAEGVETKEQCDFVLSKGCRLAQGHLFAPALPPEDLARLLRGELSHSILA